MNFSIGEEVIYCGKENYSGFVCCINENPEYPIFIDCKTFIVKISKYNLNKLKKNIFLETE